MKISRDEVLRYLGYKNHKLGNRLDNIIKEAIEECRSLIRPKFIYSEYVKRNINNEVHIDGTNIILKGVDIKNHLLFADKCIIMAVTIGSNIEKKISMYEKIDLTKALVLDSCATVAVEEICDYVESIVKSKANKENLGITFRYSPGYGDLPLDVQKNIVDNLRADKIIGLTVSEHKLLFPRKSVTAIIGLIPKDKEIKQRGCEVCKNYNKCSYRKEGHVCGS